MNRWKDQDSSHYIADEIYKQYTQEIHIYLSEHKQKLN